MNLFNHYSKRIDVLMKEKEDLNLKIESCILNQVNEMSEMDVIDFICEELSLSLLLMTAYRNLKKEEDSIYLEIDEWDEIINIDESDFKEIDDKLVPFYYFFREFILDYSVSRANTTFPVALKGKSVYISPLQREKSRNVYFVDRGYSNLAHKITEVYKKSNKIIWNRMLRLESKGFLDIFLTTYGPVCMSEEKMKAISVKEKADIFRKEKENIFSIISLNFSKEYRDLCKVLFSKIK